MSVRKLYPNIAPRMQEAGKEFLNSCLMNGVNQAVLLVRVDKNLLKSSISGIVRRRVASWGTNVEYGPQQEGYKSLGLELRTASEDEGGYTPYLRPSLKFVELNAGKFYRDAIKKAL